MSNPRDYELNGSVLAWTRDQDPDRRVEFVAIERLTDAPVSVRSRFVGELAAEYAELDAPEIATNSRSVVVENIGYIAGYYEPAGYRQKVYSAWQEAEPDVKHPIFHEALRVHDIAKIAKTN